MKIPRLPVKKSESENRGGRKVSPPSPGLPSQVGSLLNQDEGPNHVIAMNKPEMNTHFPGNFISTCKYRPWYIFPLKNLMEQFRRTTNIYFLIVVVITLIPDISPVSPLTSITPLLFVVTVSAIKEGYEDRRRHKADRCVNFAEYKVYNSDGDIIPVYSMDLRVGNLVYLEKNEIIPADMIILKSSHPEGICYVETSQLDGETNLKEHRTPPYTTDYDKEDLCNLDGFMIIEPPHPHLYSFKGMAEFFGDRISFSNDQLLLRGAVLKNTNHIVGVVVYTGPETKLSLNQSLPPSKFSRTERILNQFVVYLFSFKLLCCFTIAAFSIIFFRQADRQPYIFGENPQIDPVESGFKVFFSYFALMSYMIPISLMVSLEVVKVIQALFMEWDKDMLVENTDPITKDKTPLLGMKAVTSNLNDELGLVKNIFSDKTGTLTENRMEFSECSINGVIYPEIMDGQLQNILSQQKKKFDDDIVLKIDESVQTNNNNNNNINNGDDTSSTFTTATTSISISTDFEEEEEKKWIYEFLLTAVLCHSVVPEKIIDDSDAVDNYVFQAQSPDDVAICIAARKNGFSFVERSSKKLVVDIMGKKVVFHLLCTMDFSSERRRMGVLVRNDEGKLILYSKGADSTMFARLSESERNRTLLKKTQEQLNFFSKKGLRTLVFARKEVSEDFFRDWWEKYDLAMTSVECRESMVDNLYEEIETDFEIIGCSAIEDNLQEGVPEAIDYIMRAGIRVWVLTGDKVETAVNIGYSCRLISPDMRVMRLCEAQNKEEVLGMIMRAKKILPDYDKVSLVIDGDSLYLAMKYFPSDFFSLTQSVYSVLCCRATPIQKAQVVNLIKHRTSECCLAIGDGANDVSMIQAADIGVGIYGMEGTQAARGSDYAIRQFSHIQKLLFVHGRYSLLRNSKLIKYSFYKNLAVMCIQLWYSFFNGWSGQTFFNDWMLTTFNLTLTGFSPFFIAIFEKDASEDLIAKHPSTYRLIQSGRHFTVKSIIFWSLDALIQSVILFFIWYWYFAPNGIVRADGKPGGLWFDISFCSAYSLMVVQLRLAIMTYYWTIWNIISVVLSWFGFYLQLMLFVSYIPGFSEKMYFILGDVMSTPGWWLLLIWVPLFVLLPDFLYEFIQRNYYPFDWQILKYRGTLRKQSLAKSSDVYNEGGCETPSEYEMKTLKMKSDKDSET